MHNFWSTPEACAWARDLGYNDYKHLHEYMMAEHKVLSQQAYEALCSIMHEEMERDFAIE
jgi:hypothetical protein